MSVYCDNFRPLHLTGIFYTPLSANLLPLGDSRNRFKWGVAKKKEDVEETTHFKVLVAV